MYKKTILWDVTYRCNLRCSHCYNANKLYNEKENCSVDYYKKIFLKFVQMGIDHIHLLGGEPLQNELIFEIIKFEYSNAIVHAFQKFRAPFSGKIVHIFPEQSAVI